MPDKKKCECGFEWPEQAEMKSRHKAPCGIICQIGAALGEGYAHDEQHHSMPWNGPPETDGHYHGECPAGCFKNCCNPPGNLCGPECLRCYGCKSCEYVHPAESACVPQYGLRD